MTLSFTSNPSPPLLINLRLGLSLPDTRSKHSGIGSLADSLKCMMINELKFQNSKSSKISIPTPTEANKKVDISVLQVDLDALAKADYPTLNCISKVLEKQERNQKKLGILATDAVCVALKEEFGDAPSSPLKHQGFLGNEV
ncbi:hypothetical protein CROQUDRAFT_104053 [Cronartium quercuum f. sp. fusiforme G11]|uniref:Uncharacterized protein n=1 Tax=Cronartium quercuum f. sp. fusiforme G11 TaxID=708437 RepID=A0A9P6NRN5_9BASI|nr:hypothetical protein CROQUDRAFT_104053 [Cronartium quercuum f. sp. fusiforme G11]